MTMKQTILFFSLAVCLHARAVSNQIEQEAKSTKFKRVFCWGSLKDDEMARRYKEAGVTDIPVRNQTQLELALKYGMTPYCGTFSPRGKHGQVMTPEEEKHFAYINGHDLKKMKAADKKAIVDKRRIEMKHRYGGEPDAKLDTLNSCRIPCFLSDADDELSRKAIDEICSRVNGVKGIFFDYLGYSNFKGCHCETCREAYEKYLAENQLIDSQENKDRFYRDKLVGYYNDMIDYVKSNHPDFKVVVHVYPTFLPEPLYGNRVKADFCGQTVAWYFPWPEEKIRKYTKTVIGEQNRHFNDVTGVPFVGVNATPGKSLWRKDPATLEKELKILLDSGADSLMICNGAAMLEPGYFEIFKKYCGEPGDLEKIEAVKNGELKEAHATWWGYDKSDATNALQAAIDSKAERIIVDNVGSDWITGPISLKSDKEIIFKDGVVIRRQPGAFISEDSKGRRRAKKLFHFKGVENVKLIGEGAVRIIGEDYEPGDGAYGHAHTFCIVRRSEPGGTFVDKDGKTRKKHKFFNSKNITIKNFSVDPSGGDGIYINGAENVRLENVSVNHGYRQGFSITGHCVNLEAKNCEFNNTFGTAPKAGIDIEPNYDDVTLDNLLFENCEFNGNDFAGICLSNGTNVPANVTFRDCEIKGNQQTGIVIGHTTGKNPTDKEGAFIFEKCLISGHVNPSVTIGFHIAKNLKVIFKDCVIDNRESKFNALLIGSPTPKDLHGIEITNLTVIDDNLDRPPIIFNSKYNNALIDPIVKNVVVKNSKGDSKKFDCEAFIRESAPDPVAKSFKVEAADALRAHDLFPNSEKGVDKESVRFRGKIEYYLFAKAGTTHKIYFTNEPVHFFNRDSYRVPFEIVISSPTVPNFERVAVEFQKTLEYELKAEETGVYKFVVDSRMQTCRISSASPGTAFCTDNQFYIFGSGGLLYFAVPAGVETVKIEGGGSLREESSVSLIDASGKVVDKGEKMAGSKILSAKREDASKYEIWAIRVDASKCFIRMGAPLLPLLSTDPANLLVLKNQVGKYNPKLIEKALEKD